jgi:hypothetical protein
MRILIEYQPFGLSTVSKILIRSCITPTMLATCNEMGHVVPQTGHYDIDSVIRLLEENIEMMKTDLEIIEKLQKEGVSYIEI